MSQPPQYPPNPDEPRRDHPQGQYPSSDRPQYGQPYTPPPAYGQQSGYGPPQQGGYGQQQPSAPYGSVPYGGYGGYDGGQGGSLYDNPYTTTASGYPGPTRSQRHSGEPSGARMWRRPTARASTSIAGAGAVLLLIGLLVWAAGYFAAGVNVGLSSSGTSASGDGRRFLGAAMFAIATAVGYLIALKAKRGPLATAGTVLAALGVPLFLLFITLSIEDVYRSGAFPINVDLVYVVSIVVWLATYLFVPGLRGRAIFLGASALAFSNYVALKSAGTDSLQSVVQSGTNGALGGATGTGIAVAGIAIGLAYYLIAFWLDRRGREGAATPLALAGFVTTIGGVAAGVPDFKVSGTGVVLFLLGIALTVYGGWAGRRFTAFVWAASTIIGLILIVSDVLDTDTDSYTAFGITFIVLGAALAAIAAIAHRVGNERAELD